MLGNPYFIGFLMLVAEATINLTLGSTAVSSIALGFAAGYLFVWKNQVEMTFSDKVKVLAVYLIAVSLLALASAATEGLQTFMLFVIISLAFVYGLVTYLMMSIGSSMSFKALEKKKAEAKEVDNGRPIA